MQIFVMTRTVRYTGTDEEMYTYASAFPSWKEARRALIRELWGCLDFVGFNGNFVMAAVRAFRKGDATEAHDMIYNEDGIYFICDIFPSAVEI